MKTQTSKSKVQQYQTNRALGIYILSITFFTAAFAVITAVQYL
ncbi:MAG: hypothetical protein ACI9OS_001707 [Ulvibacter sp.]|jgi:hypothetical protein